MAKIDDVAACVKQFIKSTVGVEGRIIEVKKAADGWEAEVETSEEDKYYRSIRPDYRIMERRFYKLELNNNLEVVSYGRKEEKDKEG